MTRCKRARSIDSNADSKKPYGIACARPDTTLTLPFRWLAQLYSRINDVAGMRHRFMLAKHYNTQREYQWQTANARRARDEEITPENHSLRSEQNHLLEFCIQEIKDGASVSGHNQIFVSLLVSFRKISIAKNGDAKYAMRIAN